MPRYNCNVTPSGSISKYECGTRPSGSIDVPISMGGGLTNMNYEKLRNKPSVNGVELIGALSLQDLGLRAIYYDTTENWNSDPTLVSEEGAIYVYSDCTVEDGSGELVVVPRVRIGDGTSYLIDLPFITDASGGEAGRNYNNLTNKPSVNNVTLSGEISLIDLSLRPIYYDSTENWDAHPETVGETGAIYIYSDYTSYEDEHGNEVVVPGIRVGDGLSYLIDLPFVSASDNIKTEIIAEVIRQLNASHSLVTAIDRANWDGKVFAFMASAESETLVLSTTHQ